MHMSNFPFQNLTPFSLSKTSKTLAAMVFNLLGIFIINFRGMFTCSVFESTLTSWVSPRSWSFAKLWLLHSFHDLHWPGFSPPFSNLTSKCESCGTPFLSNNTLFFTLLFKFTIKKWKWRYSVFFQIMIECVLRFLLRFSNLTSKSESWGTLFFFQMIIECVLRFLKTE